jgi:2-polyprenyl-3-methyl-5-hydroxy-6-metoxy-1,4-benzoquinol methylase
VSEAHRRTVEAGYDRMAEQYLATKDPKYPLALAALEDLASHLPPEAAVLDLGCGAGLPVTRWLADRGFTVTGVDVSARQLELARMNVPHGTFLKADMTELAFASETFDAVVAFHSIIHVQRADHPTLLQSIHRWLKPGGVFLATMTVTDYEGRDEDWGGWGAPMVWSHYGRDANVAMLR